MRGRVFSARSGVGSTPEFALSFLLVLVLVLVIVIESKQIDHEQEHDYE
jgi:hypothetical protein